ncbi:MAG: T9SS type A sorting domain-containing protein, partial [Candidatus Aegiribacteria sp.]|nr:T9SS type A sorting domain-containing protein [Candidatus Aegiribacteria sp.]MBD3295535.1 T9SS type A sorting domain-containing protein [Candidatus Fermentibacteria bacterium]
TMISENFSYETDHYSVAIRGITMPEVRFLESEGFLIEWAREGKAMVYVDAEMERMLQNMGHYPVRMERTAPLVPFPTLDEIYDAIDDVIAAHPSICRKITIGTSIEGRPIEAVVVSDNVDNEEIEPEMRIHGSIHGDEMAAATVTLNYLEVLTDSYATSPMCEYIVNNTESWIIPVLNPDGYFHDQRTNANGVDLNRNLSYMWNGSGGGSAPFSEPETQALRDITMQDWPEIRNFVNPFTAGLSLHGGEDCINTVWNYTGVPLPEDSGLVHSQAQDYASSPGILDYFGGSFWIAFPGHSWYETHGDVNDWSYGECGTVDHTIEVHDDKHVPDWPGVNNAHYMAILDFFTQSTYGIWGTVTDTNGDPVDALVEIGISSGTDSEPLRFCRTDVTMGDYHKALLPGTYDVQVSADGYNPQSQMDIVVNSQERVEVSFVLSGTGIQGTVPNITGDFTVYPNPSSSSVQFTLPSTGVGGNVSIYDITGRSVRVQKVSPGAVNLAWDLEDHGGNRVPDGMYLARFQSGSSSWTTRVMVYR